MYIYIRLYSNNTYNFETAKVHTSNYLYLYLSDTFFSLCASTIPVASKQTNCILYHITPFLRCTSNATSAHL